MPLKRVKKHEATVEHEERQWVTIRSVSDSLQAELIKTFLESNDCDVALRDGDGFLRDVIECRDSAGDFVDIFVPLEDAHQAASLLRTHGDWSDGELSDYSDESDDYSEDDDIGIDHGHSFMEAKGMKGYYEEEELF